MSERVDEVRRQQRDGGGEVTAVMWSRVGLRVTTAPLERCTGDTPECPHTDCPDGWHDGDDLPCSCTPDCALTDKED